jgi:putative nucleotidyltransferase with HDIG domain
MEQIREAAVRGEAVRRLMDALAQHDLETYEHSVRVSRLAREVARLVGFRGERLFEVELGALLHDVGKLEIPRDLLRKTGKLSVDEFATIQSHAERGYELVRTIPGLQRAALVVRAAHEWFDGTGYPRGVAGEMIPLGGRIVAVVDAYDAMTERATYAPLRSRDEALAELAAQSGSQFDASVVPVLRLLLTFRRLEQQFPDIDGPQHRARIA